MVKGPGFGSLAAEQLAKKFGGSWAVEHPLDMSSGDLASKPDAKARCTGIFPDEGKAAIVCTTLKGLQVDAKRQDKTVRFDIAPALLTRLTADKGQGQASAI